MNLTEQKNQIVKSTQYWSESMPIKFVVDSSSRFSLERADTYTCEVAFDNFFY